MWRELDIAGVYLPPLLAYLAAALLTYVPVRLVLTRIGFWRWTWNQPVAEASIFMSLVALFSEYL